jgi:hypothetical protein
MRFSLVLAATGLAALPVAAAAQDQRPQQAQERSPVTVPEKPPYEQPGVREAAREYDLGPIISDSAHESARKQRESDDPEDKSLELGKGAGLRDEFPSRATAPGQQDAPVEPPPCSDQLLCPLPVE